MQGISWIAEKQLASQEGFCSKRHGEILSWSSLHMMSKAGPYIKALSWKLPNVLRKRSLKTNDLCNKVLTHATPYTQSRTTNHNQVWRQRKNQQDATIRCLLLTSVSTCFGHHYAHLQENKGPVTAFGVLLWFCWMWLVLRGLFWSMFKTWL